MRSRRGFTLIETLVALLLFALIMLALAAGAALAARDLAAARRVEQARETGRNRAERLAMAGCPPVASGIVTGGALTEHWFVEGDGRSRLVSDSVSFRKRDGTTGFVVARAAVLCRQ